MTMTDIFPVGMQSAGNNTFLLLGKVEPSTPPTLSEFTGETVLDITCYLPAEEVEIPFDQERVDDTRACHSVTAEAFGATTFSKDALRHIVNPQGDGSEQGNLMVDAFEANTSLYVGVVMGIKHGTALSAGDLVDVYKVETGAEHISPMQSGKYLREVKTSWTRLQHRVALTA